MHERVKVNNVFIIGAADRYDTHLQVPVEGLALVAGPPGHHLLAAAQLSLHNYNRCKRYSKDDTWCFF